MYIAKIKRDEKGHPILVGWEPYMNQDFHSFIDDGSGIEYSGFVTDQQTDPSTGIYEVDDELGIQRISVQDSTIMSDTSSLSNIIFNKISIVNRQFKEIVERVAPADYLIYLFTSTSMHEVDIHELYDWWIKLNELRLYYIQMISEVEQIEDLNNINIDFKGLDISSVSNIPIITKPYERYNYLDVIDIEYDEELKIESNSSVEIDLYSPNRIPIRGILISGKSDTYHYTWTNYSEDVINIVPDSLLFRLDDGSAVSANQVLTESVKKPLGFDRLEFTLRDNIRTRAVTLHLDNSEANTTLESLCGSKTLRGKVATFDVECDTKYCYIDTDSETIGPLFITGSTLSIDTETKTMPLIEGKLSLNLYDTSVSYEVLNETDDIIFSGNGPGNIKDLEVYDRYTLKAIFISTTSVELIDIKIKPTMATIYTHQVDLAYNKVNEKLVIYNKESKLLTGKLLLSLKKYDI